MALVKINWRPSPAELRKFGVAMIVGFGIIGLVCQFVLPEPRVGAAVFCYIFGGVAGVLGLSGTVAALPVYWLWMGIAFVMGNVVGRLLLALIYFGLITPMGLVMRIAGRDRLRMRRRTCDTYWCDVKQPTDAGRYERQF